jgi:HSP20 family molecular chaperone IbpA
MKIFLSSADSTTYDNNTASNIPISWEHNNWNMIVDDWYGRMFWNFPTTYSTYTLSCGSYWPGYDWFIDEEIKAYRLLVDLPGFAEKNIDITVENGYLKVKANRTVNVKSINRACNNSVRISIPLSLNQVVIEEATATLKDGVLEIKVPLSPKSDPINIKISKPPL